ncbi:LexA family transcriptional regulator [Halomonas sp. BN3-1]|uniref:LexA family protein n=1 Tax=Halomonas sp. BN3-1 TaxID=2082393 RepID=UPI00196568BB|nr:LexA family transcriptional regulator [Halomonas sp. BN3-1]
MLATCLKSYAMNSSSAHFYEQQKISSGVCESISATSKYAGMNSSNRSPLTPEQLDEAKRLKEVYNQRKAEAKARGDKLTQDEVAARCNWGGQSAVSQYLNGKIALNLDALLKLSRALDFEPSAVSPRLGKFMPSPSQQNVEEVQAPPQIYRYPVVSWVVAGSWAEAVEPFEPGCAEEYMETTYHAPDGGAFWLKVRGDSMTAAVGTSVPEGSWILVDTSLDARPGDLVVAKLTDSQEATFKRLVEDGGRRYLKPLNPAYPIIEINGNCTLVGVVKKAMQDL